MRHERRRLLNLQPPCWTVTSLLLQEVFPGVYSLTEQVVLRLTQQLDYLSHLLVKNTLRNDVLIEGA